MRTQRERLARDPERPELFISGGRGQISPRPWRPDTHILNAILVRLKPGADRTAVADHIEQLALLFRLHHR